MPKHSIPVLVCFAVAQEARPFRRLRWPAGPPLALLTGIGPARAQKAMAQALAEFEPGLVISAGFAGGLNPALSLGTVLFEADEAGGLGPKLLAAGAKPGRFHCSASVVATAEHKQALWRATGADAVEMESGPLRRICREHGVASATVRVISDPAGESLPLDFNLLLAPGAILGYARMTLALLKAPGRIVELLRFRRRLAAAAAALAEVLAKVIP
jgi:adenosylhomocysteine nucleosidase